MPTPSSRPPVALVPVALAAVLSLTAAACDERSDDAAGQDSVAAPADTAAPPATALAGKRWIDPADRVAPERWLASRLAGTDLAEDDPAVARMGTLLARADRAFDETPRMIANRAMQLQEMLADGGMEEPADAVIENLLTVAEGGGAHGFGEVGQHYVTLRTAGTDRDGALAALRRAGPPQP